MRRTCLLLLTAITTLAAAGSSLSPYATESEAEQRARMQWWRDAKFGMFIHWGVYAVPAGYRNGELVPGISEWIMAKGQIPIAEYRRYAERFNPVHYDPATWMDLATAAGMKYVVITAKHHDGFALFDSAASDWDVVDATPYGQDLLKPLFSAARERGLRTGFYYSQSQDWTHPGGRSHEGEWDPAHAGDFMDYINGIAVPQMRELLTNYGDIDVVWWDTNKMMTPEAGDALEPLLALQPGVISNDRLARDRSGDYGTPEGFVPISGFYWSDWAWESCDHMAKSWGYRRGQPAANWKSPRALIHRLIEVVARGGNLLLNVGPQADGRIHPGEVERLQAIAAWMAVNGEAIHGTTRSPLRKVPGGYATHKAADQVIYLHILDWPTDGVIHLPGLHTTIEHATLLADGSALSIGRDENGWQRLLAGTTPAPDPVATVIKLHLAGPAQVDPLFVQPNAAGGYAFPLEEYNLHQHGYSAQMTLTDDHLDNWTAGKGFISWDLEPKDAGRFELVIDVRAEAGATIPDLIAAVDRGQDQTRSGVSASGDWQELRFG
ncbi:MAG: alpha-L-fucosidase, partial [Planctomycetota bacterium]